VEIRNKFEPYPNSCFEEYFGAYMILYERAKKLATMSKHMPLNQQVKSFYSFIVPLENP